MANLAESNKQKGNFAVASAISHFVSMGYTVSIPLADTAKYDLVIEQAGIFQAVQCKYAGYERSKNIFAVPLYVSGGNRSAGNRRIKYQVKDFDILFVACANGNKYAIPSAEIIGQVTINLGRESKWSKWEKYLLRIWYLLQVYSGNCRVILLKFGETFRDGNAEPSPEISFQERCRDLMGSIQNG